MKLVEIKDLFRMDTGAPMPIIVSTDYNLILCFYVQKENGDYNLSKGYSDFETKIVSLTFKNALQHSFGTPNNETIHGHPYYKLGLGSYAFYELEQSDLIKELQQITKVHPYYNPQKWERFKHYIITFHDKYV